MASDKLSIAQLAPQVLSTDGAERKTYVGIDFGTSTTVVSVATFDPCARRIDVHPIRIEQKDRTGATYKEERVNTVIAIDSNKVLVGKGANELKYHLKKGRDIWYNFKMELGVNLGAQYYDSVANQGKFVIRTPKDAARVFFCYLKNQIDKYCQANGLPSDVDYAVSIPASFEANQRRDLIEALEANGIHVGKPSLIDEPNAAFLSYLHASMDSENPLVVPDSFEPTVLVFDFGGGTCDISILEISKSYDGMHSKNLAISKFAEMGGIDIDRFLTYNFLLPRFLAANGFSLSDFRSKERELIASRLYKYAEELKIAINRRLAFFQDHETLSIPEIRTSQQRETITMPVVVDTTRGTLRQEEVYLTYKELDMAMRIFLNHAPAPLRLEGQKEYNNIYMSVGSALRKAQLANEDIDYVLLIGGSAKSPHIQEALRKSFADSQILIPNDLQTHVSCGAAIHSILLNRLGACVIRPITSEPIIVLTKDAQPTVLLPAGTEIPCQPVSYSGLRPSQDGQQVVELPICIGNKDKMLVNIELTNPDGFRRDEAISVTVSVTADKLLNVTATCGGRVVEAEPQNPFANKELTTAERKVMEAKRKANDAAVANGGQPTRESLAALANAYEQAGQNLMAAETTEELMNYYPSAVDYNSLGVLYHNSGDYKKAVEWLRRAAKQRPADSTVLANLGHDLMLTGNYEEAEKVLRRAVAANPQKTTAMITLARVLDKRGAKDEALALRKEAMSLFKTQWENGSLDDCQKGWFAALAEELNDRTLARKISASINSDGESFFDADNLAVNGGSLPVNY